MGFKRFVSILYNLLSIKYKEIAIHKWYKGPRPNADQVYKTKLGK